MAELMNSCCTPAAQASCCDPSDKASCCGKSHGEGCSCGAGSTSALVGSASTATEEVRDTVRQKYAFAARAAAEPASAGCRSPADEQGVFGFPLYADSGETDISDAAVSASLGCGVPTAVADLHEGQTVLDLGSGAGADVLISRGGLVRPGRR